MIDKKKMGIFVESKMIMSLSITKKKYILYYLS